MHIMHNPDAMLSLHRWLALEEPIGQHLVRTATWCSRVRPVTSPSPSSAHTQTPGEFVVLRGYSDHRDALQEQAICSVIAIGSHYYELVAWYRTHVIGGGFPGAIQLLPTAHMHPVCIAQRTSNMQLAGCAVRTNGPLCARVACERLHALVPSEYARIDGLFAAHGRINQFVTCPT
jgi:hypothetical protein